MTIMSISTFFNKVSIIAFVINICTITNLYGQSVSGNWKYVKESIEKMQLGYNVSKGKVNFKKDGTFYVKLSGRSLLGHKFYPYRSFFVKVQGVFTIANDSIFLKTIPQNILCFVDLGKEDPHFSPNYEKSLERATWNYLDIKYESELSDCKYQEKNILEQMYRLWNGWYSIYFINKKLYIGDKITLIH